MSAAMGLDPDGPRDDALPARTEEVEVTLTPPDSCPGDGGELKLVIRIYGGASKKAPHGLRHRARGGGKGTKSKYDLQTDRMNDTQKWYRERGPSGEAFCPPPIGCTVKWLTAAEFPTVTEEKDKGGARNIITYTYVDKYNCIKGGEAEDTPTPPPKPPKMKGPISGGNDENGELGPGFVILPFMSGPSAAMRLGRDWDPWESDLAGAMLQELTSAAAAVFGAKNVSIDVLPNGLRQ